MIYSSVFHEIKICYRPHTEVFEPAPAPPVCAPKGTKFENFGFFSGKMFFLKFQKNKSDKMCHMGACMVRPFWDVKALSLVNLLRQKKFSNFEKKISSQIPEGNFPLGPRFWGV